MKPVYRRPHIEITTQIGCANNCIYCPQKILLENYYKYDKNRIKSLSLTSFNKLLNKIPEYMTIDFGGMCEPFGNPHTMEMILLANERHRKISIFTTLRGLNIENLSILSKIHLSAFVVHCPDKDQYMHLIPDEKYIKLVKFIKKNIKNASFVTYGRPYEKITKITGSEFQSAIHLRAGLLNTEEMPDCFEIQAPVVQADESIICNVALQCDPLPIRPTRIEYPVLLPDGTMLLCCMDYEQKYVLGNLFKQSWEEIYEGDAMQMIEKAMRNEICDNVLCRNCSFATPYDEYGWKIFKKIGIYGSFKFLRKKNLFHIFNYKIFTGMNGYISELSIGFIKLLKIYNITLNKTQYRLNPPKDLCKLLNYYES
jgi:hypothetical protein